MILEALEAVAAAVQGLVDDLVAADPDDPAIRSVDLEPADLVVPGVLLEPADLVVDRMDGGGTENVRVILVVEALPRRLAYAALDRAFAALQTLDLAVAGPCRFRRVLLPSSSAELPALEVVVPVVVT